MFNIVLVAPEIPANTGNIGRTCVVTGSRLHLVGPLGFSLDEKSLHRAGLGYWESLDVTVYADWDEFVEKNELRLTTIGRAILSLILPRGMSYDHIDPPVEGVTQDNIREILHEKNWFTKVSNQPLGKKRIAGLLNTCYRLLGLKDTVMFADRVMYTGFRNAAISGSSVCVDDMLTPKEKPAIIAAAQKEVLSIQQQ